MGVVGRAFAFDAVCSTSLVVLSAGICCCVDTMAALQFGISEKWIVGKKLMEFKTHPITKAASIRSGS